MGVATLPPSFPTLRKIAIYVLKTFFSTFLHTTVFRPTQTIIRLFFLKSHLYSWRQSYVGQDLSLVLIDSDNYVNLISSNNVRQYYVGRRRPKKWLGYQMYQMVRPQFYLQSDGWFRYIHIWGHGFYLYYMSIQNFFYFARIWEWENFQFWLETIPFGVKIG